MFCKQNLLCVSCQALRSAVCAQRRACSPSERAGRSPQRRTSWRPLTRSSSPTPSSAPPPDTWPTTERVCVWERELTLWLFTVKRSRELSQKILSFCCHSCSLINKVYSRIESHPLSFVKCCRITTWKLLRPPAYTTQKNNFQKIEHLLC